ncbi:hypothetical protein CBR_g30547 [Chara braunii]|uniref:Uncharacterized protein n=1 Tax=Chara braunii TaxID=69332 RepID=A0A388LCY9_CHABU|nr:hypothetical protein CBR_g30547 [Chara braunii]|eukprot:GBG80181.1 hypothetical protein CBR_g30547 [Chara braunii]
MFWRTRQGLWVDDNRFWNETEGSRLYKIVNNTCNYLLCIIRGVHPPLLPRKIILPHSSIAQVTITDESQLHEAKERSSKVQRVILHVIHEWIFKSNSTPRGYTAAYGYLLQHVATDIPRAMWFAEEWSVCVSSAFCHFTLELDIQLPLWFVGLHIEDRPDDDELATYQEAMLQRLVSAFMSVVGAAKLQDGGRVSNERLKNVAEGMMDFMVVVMWLMRMLEDDLRSYYEASFFLQLVAKPTQLASMHRSFDARQHIKQAANIVAERLGKPLITLVIHPGLGVMRCEIHTRRKPAIARRCKTFRLNMTTMTTTSSRKHKEVRRPSLAEQTRCDGEASGRLGTMFV